ncbi:MAG: HDOD domain-containing protein [Desulfobacterales bacterium]|uniref:histidine kinase n=1 Tax=Candidatus Desulfatibia vada TaxID=2841696 RepID=A0A8J6P1J9_9BACT|nr:HDOD domain-containing protein [Candidatus Desulfatibia vada]MBL6971086.1 HDOD domain-containing protein [Desulfobacterales bacterium]
MEKRHVQFFDKIKTSKNLPSLPQILLKLIELCNSEESTFKGISQTINKDASLSAKVINMVNSAYYGVPKRVTNINQSLVILGQNAIKNIAISASVIQAFSKAKDDSVFSLKVFWRHSLMCAILSELIAKKISYASPDEAFLTGLLHDIGKLVLWVNFPREYADILKSSQDQWDLILAGEARHGATHCEVGAWLINRWKLQSFMADAVRYHHEAVDRIQDALPLVKIIYVGNILCPETNKEKEVKFGITKNIFGFETSEVEEIILQAEKDVSDIAQSLGIDIGALDVSEKDHKKQEDLIQKVKDITLFQGTLQNLLEAHDEDSILKVTQEGLHILFGVKHVLFFLHESERNILLGKSVALNNNNDLINEVAVPLQEEKSLLAKSLLQRKPLDSLSDIIKDKLTILDEQIIRLVEKDGILCLPMIAHKQYVGVIVLGLEEARAPHLTDKIKLLMMFTKQAALALQANYLTQNQAKLIQSERLNATSTIAQKIVHEANTPLSIIKNYLAILKRKLSEDQPVEEEIRIINEEIDRVALIISELSDFSELKIQPNDPLDVNALLSNLTRIFQESLILEPNIKTHLKLDPSLPAVMTDKNRMTQVFSNLIKNAAEAMSGRGNLGISTRYISNYMDDKTNQVADNTQGHVEIIIEDDGPGIPDTVKTQLFEPYITSKGAGHAGLGLSIVYNAVKKLQGTITFESDNKQGTSFKINLPIAQHQES